MMPSSHRLLGSRLMYAARHLSSKSPGNGEATKMGRKLSRTPSFMNLSEKDPSSSYNLSKSSPKTAEEAVNNLLYNFNNQTTQSEDKKHVLSVFVDNEAGVLSKVSGLMSARGFNIDSLSVSNTDVHDLSRMTIVLKGGEEQMEQAKRQLQDLCDVWAVFDHLSPEATLSRELCLAKVSVVPPTVAPSSIEDEGDEDKAQSYDEMMAIHFHRQAIGEVAKLFGATVCDVGSETIVLELVSWPRRIDAFLKMLRPFKVVEAARTGMIAMTRSKVVDPERDGSLAGEDKYSKVDLSDLPPS